MAGQRKLGRPTDQRMAILRGLVTDLFQNGKVTTTVARAKEVRKIAENIITIAMDECDNTVTVQKTINNVKDQSVEVEFVNDSPSRLAARRRIMAMIYEAPIPRKEKESKEDYAERTQDINHPLVEKIFREIAPKYKKRAQEIGTKGGYTRILKLGPRRGDGAESVVLELI
ncbi:MAG: 50S ribosomal protein L17 [Christensenellales bacterium]|jgi:large subunit ribosomal protein L17